MDPLDCFARARDILPYGPAFEAAIAMMQHRHAGVSPYSAAQTPFGILQAWQVMIFEALLEKVMTNG